MTDKQDSKKRRAGKRYTYSRAAQCEVEGDSSEVQLLNISASGVQFATRMKIDLEKVIKIKWKDSQYGSFEPTLLIVREVHKPESPDYQYYYGSQYYNLAEDVKKNLLVLLKAFKDEEKKTSQQQIEKLTPIYVFDVIEQGNSYLRRIFSEDEKPSHFENILKEIGEYERTAFKLDDEISFAIQKLTTHNFQCNLLGMLTPIVVEKPEVRTMFFQYVLAQLKKINVIENEVETTVKKVLSDTKNDEENKNSQKRINESSNRLFYTKHALLQSIVETFGDVDPESPEFKETLGRIKEEYERILEFTNPSLKYEMLTYKRRTKIQEDLSKAEEIIDVPVLSEKKPPYFIIFAVLFLLTLGAVYGYEIFRKDKLKDKMQRDMEISISIIKSAKFGTQLDLTFHAEDWNKLTAVQKDDVYKKISNYLKKQNSKSYLSSVIYTDNGRLVKTVYKDQIGRK